MIAASILEYMFITVTCCEETAKKLFEHSYNNLHTCCSICMSYCRKKLGSFSVPAACCPAADSRTFQVLEILQTEFQDFPGGVRTLLKPCHSGQ